MFQIPEEIFNNALDRLRPEWEAAVERVFMRHGLIQTGTDENGDIKISPVKTNKEISELIIQSRNVANFLESPGTAGVSASGFRFSPELRSIAPKLRAAADAVERLIARPQAAYVEIAPLVKSTCGQPGCTVAAPHTHPASVNPGMCKCPFAKDQSTEWHPIGSPGCKSISVQK